MRVLLLAMMVVSITHAMEKQEEALKVKNKIIEIMVSKRPDFSDESKQTIL